MLSAVDIYRERMENRAVLQAFAWLEAARQHSRKSIGVSLIGACLRRMAHRAKAFRRWSQGQQGASAGLRTHTRLQTGTSMLARRLRRWRHRLLFMAWQKWQDMLSEATRQTSQNIGSLCACLRRMAVKVLLRRSSVVRGVRPAALARV